jgi:phosphatidylglycerophosphatase A
MFILKWLQKLAATLFFIGYIPPMPGTIGSAATAACLWYVHFVRHITLSPEAWWIIALGLTAFSMIASSRPAQVFGQEDPKYVIIDECAGQFITFLFIPITINTLVLGFLLFRFFDIVKPFPIYKMEELDGGVGITMDDVIAGIYANASLLLILWGYNFIRASL